MAADANREKVTLAGARSEPIPSLFAAIAVLSLG